jgi:hypothetical protein
MSEQSEPSSEPVDGQAEVPTGDQQMVVDWFRGAGWTVEQDHGTSFDAPQWGP